MAMSDKVRSVEPDIINLVLFFCAARSGHFGQGTFVNTVLSFVKPQENIKVTIINTDSREAKEVTTRVEDDIEYIIIPSPENKLNLNTEDNIIQRSYARRIIDISLPYIEKKENIVFWVNSIDFLNVAEEIKARFGGVKLFYVHHAWSWKHFKNIADEEFGAILLNEERDFNPRAIEWTGYQKKMALIADKTITVTRHARYFFEKYLNVPPKKIVTVYNGIDPETIKTYDKAAIRKKYGFGIGEKIILYSGRVTAEKGLPFVLKAFHLIAEMNENVRLIVVGNGKIAEYIPLAAPFWSRVVYTGELPKDQVYELYSMADVGIQPSLIEQCSFTAIEMCFHQLPLVVSSDIGLDEMFDDRMDALKVKVCYDEEGIKYLDETEIAENIMLLLDHPEMGATLSRNALEKAREMFNISCMKEAYLSLFDELITSPEMQWSR